MTDFMTIKDSVSVPQAAEYYGIDIRHDMCRCIFHEDRHPSMKLYPNNYFCFGCGAHGAIIQSRQFLQYAALFKTFFSKEKNLIHFYQAPALAEK